MIGVSVDKQQVSPTATLATSCSLVKTRNNPIETAGAEDAGVLVNKDALIQSFVDITDAAGQLCTSRSAVTDRLFLPHVGGGGIIPVFCRLCVNFSQPWRR